LARRSTKSRYSDEFLFKTVANTKSMGIQVMEGDDKKKYSREEGAV